MPKRTETEQEQVVLDPESLAALEEGIRSEETGREYSWDEAKEFARARRKEWMKVAGDLSA